MRIIFLLATLISLQSFGSTQFYLSQNGTQRDYWVHVPPSYNAANSYPVVFNLHGYGSNSLQQELYSRMNAVADTANFIIVYANGLSNSWNAGYLGGVSNTTDDVGFISQVLDSVLQNFSVDAARVYSCGMSNGGYMSYKLACELENRIAAIASVTGSLTDSTAANCVLSRNIPVMQIHGTMDPLVSYNGFPSSMPIEDLIQYWVAKNNCAITSDTTPIPNINTNDTASAVRIRYNTCDAQTKVWFIRVDSGGHTWPATQQFNFPLGSTCKDFDASVEIWRFFRQFSNPDAPTALPNLRADVSLHVFPNPAQNELRIESDEMLDEIVVTNLLGEEVLRETVMTHTTPLNISALASGMYVLRAKNRALLFVRE